MDKYAFGRNLTKILHEKGIKQARLADKADLSAVSLSRYANGSMQPSVYTLYKIAKALGVSMESLITGIDEGEV